MKNILLSFLFIFSATVNAATNDQLFTKKQRAAVLQTIDSHCGDTWCEGEYNFKFLDFDCQKSTSTCELKFQFIKALDQDSTVASSVETCKFSNIKTFLRVMEDEYSLNESFLEELTDCITTKENAVKF